MIGEELEGDDGEQGAEGLGHVGHVEDLLGDGAYLLVALGGDGDDRPFSSVIGERRRRRPRSRSQATADGEGHDGGTEVVARMEEEERKSVDCTRDEQAACALALVQCHSGATHNLQRSHAGTNLSCFGDADSAGEHGVPRGASRWR